MVQDADLAYDALGKESEETDIYGVTGMAAVCDARTASWPVMET